MENLLSTIERIKSLREKYSRNSTIIKHAHSIAEKFNENSNDYEIQINADTSNHLDLTATWFSFSIYRDGSLVKSEKC